MKKFSMIILRITLSLMLTICIAQQTSAQSNELGEKIFKSQCMACHAIEVGKNKIGPSLAGMVGSKAGTVLGFAYSSANKQADLVWDEVALDKFLTEPKVMMPGNKMMFAGLKSEDERKALIAYLKKQ